MKELEKTYNPADTEDRLYQKWLDKKYFHAEVNRSKKPFTIVMSPSNITGRLHMGRALGNAMQDVLIRYKRIQGYEALWQPGTDHAAIATEVKVINKLRKEDVDKADLERDGFLKEYWKWRDEYGTRIVNQLYELGSSADWDRERFTMDHGCFDAVLEVFVKLYEKDYIYKGSRIINWCPVCQTSIFDAEVEHVEQSDFFWHINYPVVGEPGRFVEIATTRPETMLGDTAVAVNPEDERYQDTVGKMPKLPLTDREISVIADPYMDKEFGTGCVKVTPARDPNDFEVGKRHNLEEIIILNDDATVNIPGSYFGMDRYEARKAIVADLETQGLLVKVVPYSHNVGTHDHCKITVEPMMKQQWFVKTEKTAKPTIEALENGGLTFVPESSGRTYLHWLEGTCDWYISRQLWWGHRIPAYYCQECGEVVVFKEAPHTCSKCGCTSLKQDEDILDTWFSSTLWPFSTLGWPKKTEDLDYFYPTDVLVTGYDIILFWVIRMVFFGLEQAGKLPLHTMLIHSLIRDSEGRKTSKPLGNGIDPLEVIGRYSAGALCMILITGNVPGSDIRFYWERVENSRNFTNKVWSASRFIMMNIKKATQPGEVALDRLTMADKWIISKVDTLTRGATENLDKYELGIALQEVYDSIWEEFCDWYIEMVKPRLYNEEDDTRAAVIWTLKHVLTQALKLLHPFIPFISEEIFCNLQGEEETIVIPQWPIYRDDWNFAKEEQSTEIIKEAVRVIRGARSSMNVPPSKKTIVYVASKDAGLLQIFERSKSFFAVLGYAGEVILQENREGVADNAVSTMIHKAVIYMPFTDLVDIEKEIERLRSEEKHPAGELARSRGMLGNEKFVNRALEAKIAEERARPEKYKQMMEQAKIRLAQPQ